MPDVLRYSGSRNIYWGSISNLLLYLELTFFNIRELLKNDLNIEAPVCHVVWEEAKNQHCKINSFLPTSCGFCRLELGPSDFHDNHLLQLSHLLQWPSFYLSFHNILEGYIHWIKALNLPRVVASRLMWWVSLWVLTVPYFFVFTPLC